MVGPNIYMYTVYRELRKLIHRVEYSPDMSTSKVNVELQKSMPELTRHGKCAELHSHTINCKVGGARI